MTCCIKKNKAIFLHFEMCLLRPRLILVSALNITNKFKFRYKSTNGAKIAFSVTEKRLFNNRRIMTKIFLFFLNLFTGYLLYYVYSIAVRSAAPQTTLWGGP